MHGIHMTITGLLCLQVSLPSNPRQSLSPYDTRGRFSDIGWRRSPPTTPQMVLRHRSCHSPHPATAHPTSPVPPPARRCARRARRARRFGWHGRSAERSFSGEVWAWNRRNMEELTRAKRCTKSCGFHWSFKLWVSACNLFNHPLSTVPSPGKVQHGPTNENNLILSSGFGFKITVLETEYTRLVVQALFPARTIPRLKRRVPDVWSWHGLWAATFPSLDSV